MHSYLIFPLKAENSLYQPKGSKNVVNRLTNGAMNVVFFKRLVFLKPGAD